MLFNEWSTLEQVWVTEMETKCDVDVLEMKFQLPSDSDISEDEVIQIATNELALAFDWEEEDLTVYQLSFFHFRGETALFWYVSFVEGGYVLLDQSGSVVNHQAFDMLTPQEQFEQDGAVMTKALAIQQYKDNTFRMPAHAQIAYNPMSIQMPSEEHCSLEEAIAIGKERILNEYGLSEALFDEKYEDVFSIMYRSDMWALQFYHTWDDYFIVWVDALVGELSHISHVDESVG